MNNNGVVHFRFCLIRGEVKFFQDPVQLEGVQQEDNRRSMKVALKAFKPDRKNQTVAISRKRIPVWRDEVPSQQINGELILLLDNFIVAKIYTSTADENMAYKGVARGHAQAAQRETHHAFRSQKEYAYIRAQRTRPPNRGKSIGQARKRGCSTTKNRSQSHVSLIR